MIIITKKYYFCSAKNIKTIIFLSILFLASIIFNIYLVLPINQIIDVSAQNKTIDSLMLFNAQSVEYIDLLEQENSEKKETIKIIYREKKDNYINLPIDSRIEQWIKRTNSSN